MFNHENNKEYLFMLCDAKEGKDVCFVYNGDRTKAIKHHTHGPIIRRWDKVYDTLPKNATVVEIFYENGRAKARFTSKKKLVI